MKELSLNILDIVENSIKNGAKNVELIINEDRKKDILSIVVKDDGRGMDEKILRDVFDPFVTTSKNKNVGLGLPLLKEEAEGCGGSVKIESKKGKGTVVKVTFRCSHIDRPPMGDIVSSVISIIATNPDTRFSYMHTVNGKTERFVTDDVKAALGANALKNLRILKEIERFLRDKVKSLYGGETDGKN